MRAIYEKVNPTVVVIRAKGRDVTGTGVVGFTEIGSRVLISADGKVMTAAHERRGHRDRQPQHLQGRRQRGPGFVVSINTAKPWFQPSYGANGVYYRVVPALD